MAQLKVMDPVAQLAAELGQFAACGCEAPVGIERQRVGLYWNRKPGWELGARSCREAADVSIPRRRGTFL